MSRIDYTLWEKDIGFLSKPDTVKTLFSQQPRLTQYPHIPV